MLDKTTFFDRIRPSNLFHNHLNQQQVDGINAILDCWNSGPEGLFKPPVYDAHLSYMLATVYHETAQTMSAVREGLNASDAWRKSHLRYYPWYGRGLVHLTPEAVAKYNQIDDPDKVIEAALMSH